MPMIGTTLRPALGLGLLVLLAACAAGPRGAGLQSEVLAQSSQIGKSAVNDALPQEFGDFFVQGAGGQGDGGHGFNCKLR